MSFPSLCPSSSISPRIASATHGPVEPEANRAHLREKMIARIFTGPGPYPLLLLPTAAEGGSARKGKLTNRGIKVDSGEYPLKPQERTLMPALLVLSQRCTMAWKSRREADVWWEEETQMTGGGSALPSGGFRASKRRVRV